MCRSLVIQPVPVQCLISTVIRLGYPMQDLARIQLNLILTKNDRGRYENEETEKGG
jgi:hypothetical protein